MPVLKKKEDAKQYVELVKAAYGGKKPRLRVILK